MSIENRKTDQVSKEYSRFVSTEDEGVCGMWFPTTDKIVDHRIIGDVTVLSDDRNIAYVGGTILAKMSLPRSFSWP